MKQAEGNSSNDRCGTSDCNCKRQGGLFKSPSKEFEWIQTQEHNNSLDTVGGHPEAQGLELLASNYSQ